MCRSSWLGVRGLVRGSQSSRLLWCRGNSWSRVELWAWYGHWADWNCTILVAGSWRMQHTRSGREIRSWNDLFYEHGMRDTQHRILQERPVWDRAATCEAELHYWDAHDLAAWPDDLLFIGLVLALKLWSFGASIRIRVQQLHVCAQRFMGSWEPRSSKHVDKLVSSTCHQSIPLLDRSLCMNSLRHVILRTTAEGKHISSSYTD